MEEEEGPMITPRRGEEIWAMIVDELRKNPEARYETLVRLLRGVAVTGKERDFLATVIVSSSDP